MQSLTAAEFCNTFEGTADIGQRSLRIAIYEYTLWLNDGRDAEYKDGRSARGNYFPTLALLGSSSQRPKLTSLVARGQSAAPGRAGVAAPSFAVVHSRPPRTKCVAGEAEPCSAVLAGDRERSGGLRTCRRPSLLFRGRFAGERGRRCRQDFPLGRNPMLIGLAVHEAICAPDLEGALANAVFEALIHVNVLIWLMMTLLHLQAELTTGYFGAHSRQRMFRLAQTTCRPDAGAPFCQITLRPCRSSIHAQGRSATHVSNAARATAKVPASASSFCPALSTGTTLNVRIAVFHRPKLELAELSRVETYLRREHVPDDLTNKGPQDRSRISLLDPDEVQYWADKFNVSKERLSEAVRNVGHSAAAVEKELKKLA
jgi:hypothetical protein